MSYAIWRKILFCLPEEFSHRLALKALSIYPNTVTKNSPVECMGLTFPNRIGLAAGLDKNGEYLDGLSKLGFGFIEVGTITPKPQPGNPKPRLFRIPQKQAILNRMGFNNKGVDYLVNCLKKSNYHGIVGINIGKNKATELENAYKDYLYCLEKVYPYASYVAVNLSSPNTPSLRELQTECYLEQLLKALKTARERLEKKYKKYVPIVIKVSPDESFKTIQNIIKNIEQLDFDGVIATNTTVDKNALINTKFYCEQGGLSGAPLKEKSTLMIKTIRDFTDKPIIGVGGILSCSDLREKLDAGANLVQIYTGLIYQGPHFIKELFGILKTKENSSMRKG